MTIVHHHLIYQAHVGRTDLGADAEPKFREFLYSLMHAIDMEELIPPQFKFSHGDAWTGLLGIVTSHISFHYWTIEKYVQLDIYSCKPFDKNKTVDFLNDFWKGSDVRTLFIDREMGKNFEIVEHNH